MAHSITQKEVLERELANPEVKQEYDALEQEFEVREVMIQLRRKMHMSQGDLAKLLGTKQTYISRLESGKIKMTLPYFARVVRALNADVEVTIIPKNGSEPIKTRIAVG